MLTADEKAARIRRRIRAAESRLVQRFKALSYQDAIGGTLCIGAAGGMLALGWLYALGDIPAIVCILGNAFLASILHEIEHDLIHRLYYARSPWRQHLMMFVVWVFRGNVPHGWYRRSMHYDHHARSGTESDIEERILGLGMPWGFRRLLISVDPLAAYLLNARRLEREIPGFDRFALALATIPVYPVFVGVLAGYVLRMPIPAVTVLAVAWVFPNMIRQASLQIVSSNVHYYEDVQDVTEETQVLRPFYLWPLQLFCFNFGTTHGLHHYVVEQPFYIRQLISSSVLPYLRRLDIRENDTGTFRRANRRG